MYCSWCVTTCVQAAFICLIQWASDMYSAVIGQAPLIDALFLRLRKKVAAEIRFQDEIIKAKGALTMILSATVLESS